MAERFHTSRVSVREAYRSLEEPGLLTIRRGAEGGAFITDLDHKPVVRSFSLMLRLGRTTPAEIAEACLLVEPPIARLAARRARADDLARLDEVVGQRERALDQRGDGAPFDRDFHRVVAACAHNLPLQSLIDALSELTAEVAAGVDLSTAAQRAMCASHRQIADAIKRRDEEAAYARMLEHVTRIQDRLGRALARRRRRVRQPDSQPRGARTRRRTR
jgi:DNA-binding FadR family transcriptional regulator